jgi:hypothetical protein
LFPGRLLDTHIFLVSSLYLLPLLFVISARKVCRV